MDVFTQQAIDRGYITEDQITNRKSGMDRLSDWAWGPDYKPEQFQFDPGQWGTGEAGQRMQGLLEQQAAGRGPSLGRGMMQEGLQQAIKNQRAQTAGMMGTNPALAAKLGGQQGAEMTRQTMRDVGQVGMQEQMMAQQALQQWLQQQRQAQMQLQMAQSGQLGMQQQMMNQQAMQDQGAMGTIANIGGTVLGAMF